MKAFVTTILFFLCYIASGQQFRLQKILTSYSINGPIVGEQHFYYPGNRGSDYKNGIINYDSATAFNNGYASRRYKRTYDSANRIITDNNEAVSTPPYYSTMSRSYSYDSAGRLAKATYSESEHRHDPYYSTSVYIYDSSSLLTEINTTGSGSVYMPPYAPLKTTYSYDSAKNVVCILQQYMDTIQQAYVNTRKDSFIYSAGNVLVEKRQENWQNNAWQLKYKYEYSYTAPNVKPVEILLSFYDTGANPYHSTKWLVTYNSLGDTTEVVVQGPKQSGFVNFGKTEYIYNAYNQPDKIIESRWDTSTSAWMQPRYVWQHIYEIYWPTGIQEKMAEAEPIKIYPNPANNNVSITLPRNTSYAVRAAIYDMQGRLVKSVTTLPAQTGNYEVDVSVLVSGYYVIKLSGKDLNTSVPFSIIR